MLRFCQSAHASRHPTPRFLPERIFCMPLRQGLFLQFTISYSQSQTFSSQVKILLTCVPKNLFDKLRAKQKLPASLPRPRLTTGIVSSITNPHVIGARSLSDSDGLEREWSSIDLVAPFPMLSTGKWSFITRPQYRAKAPLLCSVCVLLWHMVLKLR